MLKNDDKAYSRREFLRIAGVAGAALGVSGGVSAVVTACGGDQVTTSTTALPAETTETLSAEPASQSTTTVTTAAESARPLTFGVVSPQTGALAGFATAVNWAVDRLDSFIKAQGGIICGDGTTRGIKFAKQDTQSDPNRAATVTADLIQFEKADIILSAGAPDTVNPSADAAEAIGCPSLSAASVWQAFYFERHPPEDGFKWTYGILLGSELTIQCFAEMFDQVPNNKKVGMLFANDADAAGWMAPNGAPQVFQERGYTLVEPSWYTPGAEDFTTQIAMFKKEGCEIVCGSNNAAEFTNFWKQAQQQGFRPKLCSSGKALLFPETLKAIGPIGYGLIGELGWHRAYPWPCSVTGATGDELADDYEAKMGQVANTNTTSMHELVEWAVDVFKRAKKPEDKETVVEAIRTTNMFTTNGPADFTQPVDINSTHHPVPNVVKASVCGGQWVKGTKYPFEHMICSNATAPDVKVQAQVQPLTYQS